MQDSTRLSDYLGVVATAWGGSFGRDAVRFVEGRDTDVVVLGTTAVFRFPRHQQALDALPREVAALAAISAYDGIGDLLPTVLKDCSDNPLGRSFVAQRYLGGEPLPRGSVDALGPLAYRFAAELARVLDALAAVPTDGLPLPAGEAEDGAPDPVVVHGDLTGNALRWDPDTTRLTGVLGWSRVHLGDPAYDLASLATTYAWELAETVADASSRLDDGVMRRARAYAARSPR